MVRTRSFDPGSALSTAVSLFASRGYADTSMEDLVRATGVSRYGLYSTFGNKKELFEQALDIYASRMGKEAFARLSEPGAGLADIRKIFASRIEDMCGDCDNKGCLFIHTVMEMGGQGDELKRVIRRYMKGMTRAFGKGLVSAQERGEAKPDLDVRAASEQLTSLMFGLAVLGRTGFPRTMLERVADQTFDSIAA